MKGYQNQIQKPLTLNLIFIYMGLSSNGQKLFLHSVEGHYKEYHFLLPINNIKCTLLISKLTDKHERTH